jgi:hypothetical protein
MDAQRFCEYLYQAIILFFAVCPSDPDCSLLPSQSAHGLAGPRRGCCEAAGRWAAAGKPRAPGCSRSESDARSGLMFLAFLTVHLCAVLLWCGFVRRALRHRLRLALSAGRRERERRVAGRWRIPRRVRICGS